ncbi:Beta-lactamase-like protein sdnR [Lachnellula suecica]|uniref:Beta-lactamase-like protein sdnR n=1 Tax=Lachnellula suecica TaxID=602035 RepID=A0A8T9C5M7_9HELO|nr:Beta-lactamase-like protein sdnR [Lachnellula suecica]
MMIFKSPDFLAPKNLCSSAAIQAAITNLTQVLSETLSTGKTAYGPFDATNSSYALEIFSNHDPNLIFSNYSNGQYLANSPTGVKNIDTNTIFRIGSLTKLLTVYTFLVNAGDIKFNDPVTKYIPELAAAAAASLNATQNPIDTVDWNDITLGELASQTAGIGRDYAGFGELASPLNGAINASALGLPPLANTSLLLCAGAPPAPAPNSSRAS